MNTNLLPRQLHGILPYNQHPDNYSLYPFHLHFQHYPQKPLFDVRIAWRANGPLFLPIAVTKRPTSRPQQLVLLFPLPLFQLYPHRSLAMTLVELEPVSHFLVPKELLFQH